MKPLLLLGVQSMEMSIRDPKKSSLSAMPSVALHDNYTRGIDISQGKETFTDLLPRVFLEIKLPNIGKDLLK